MGKLFDAIYESVLAANNVGGYKAGDIVEFKKNYKSSPTYKDMSTELKQAVDELATCGLNIVITQVGDRFSGASAGNQFKTTEDTTITVGADQGGRRIYNTVTITLDMVDLVDSDGVNLPKVADEFKRKDIVNIKPRPVDDYSKNITRLTDKGNGKNTPTDLKLAGESTILKNDMANLGMLYEATSTKDDMITDRERQMITNAITKAGLDGNGRFPTVGRAINKLTEVLDNLGYSLDAVYDERIPKAHYAKHSGGFKGQNLLTFRKKNMSEDPFNEEPEIENSRISFNWENLGGTGEDAAFEVVAYAS